MLLDYELIGSLQVSNGIVSGFNKSTSNYIKIPYSLPMGSNKVEICFSLYYSDLSSASVMLANYNDAASGGGLVLRTDGNYSTLKYWGWNSSGTMIAEGINLGFNLTAGTNIIKFVYENSTITWYKSTDGKNFTQGASKSGTIADFKNYIVIGASGTAWYSGNMQVNMLDSYIKVNDEYWHSKEYIKQKTKIIQRHDTAANWTTINPILALGEMGVETDTNKFKFGDGVTAWTSLAYAAGEGGSGDAYTKTETDSLLTAKQDKLTAVSPIKIYTDNKQIPNVTLHDGATIGPDNIYHGANGPYLSFNPGVDLSTASSWEYRIKIKFPSWTTPTGYPYQALVINTDYSNNYQLVLNFIHDGSSFNKQTIMFLSSNGTVWNIPRPTKDNSPFIEGSIYYIAFGFTGSQYYIKYNETGWSNSFTTIASQNTSTKVASSNLDSQLGGPVQPFYGDIYLEESSLTVNGGVAWTGTRLQSGVPHITANPATNSSLGVVQPDGTSITVSEAGVISGQDVKTFTGYSDTGTLVLKSINGALQWVAEA